MRTRAGRAVLAARRHKGRDRLSAWSCRLSPECVAARSSRWPYAPGPVRVRPAWSAICWSARMLFTSGNRPG